MLFLSVVLASTLACQPAPDGSPIGFWESNAMSQGGIGGNIEFRVDGSYSKTMTVLVDFVYKLEGGVLYTASAKERPTDFKNGRQVEISSDAYSIVSNDGDTEIRKRIGTRKTDSMVGIYSYRHYSGAIAYEKFTDDGQFHLRIPMREQHGCFSIDQDEISFNQADGPLLKVYFTLKTKRLELENSEVDRVYKLVPEGAWYHVDKVDYVKPESFTPEN